ncbi:MAG TPA: hypothetical protein VGU71_12270 [Candidatus Dormibacteraeota bacterium]|nr:hypothetical protein [Candidatus Dormibacteraeota bacterium]
MAAVRALTPLFASAGPESVVRSAISTAVVQVVVIFGGAVWIVIYVWLGIPATIKAYRAHTQAGPEQLVLEDDQIQIRLQQHEGAHVYLSKVSKVLPNDEHFKSGVPRVPLPA